MARKSAPTAPLGDAKEAGQTRTGLNFGGQGTRDIAPALADTYPPDRPTPNIPPAFRTPSALLKVVFFAIDFRVLGPHNRNPRGPGPSAPITSHLRTVRGVEVKHRERPSPLPVQALLVARGGSLRIPQPSAPVRSLFQLTALDHLLEPDDA